MAFTMTSKKSGHENSGFKLLWQMVCVLLTAGCMLIRYVLLKGLGRATEEMPPACLVLAAALWVRRSRLWGREMASSPKILGRGEKCKRGGCREQREHPSFGQGGAESWRRCPKVKGGWQLLETPLRGGWAKLYRPVCKDTMNRREFVYKPS